MTKWFLKRRVTSYGVTYELFDGSGLAFQPVNKFLESLSLINRSAQTLVSYGYDLLHFYTWLGTTQFSFQELTKYDLLEYVKYQKEKSAASRSINRRLSTILQYYHFCTGKDMTKGIYDLRQAGYYKGQYMPPNMGILPRQKNKEKALRVKEEDTLIDPLEVEEVKKFFSSLKKYRDVAIVSIMLYCGLRSVEIINLKLQDISEHYKALLVRGKGGKQRKVVLSPLVLEAIQKYQNFERPQSETDRLFVVLKGPHRGEPMTRAGLRRLFRYRRDKIKQVKRANPHRFRHTFATNMARHGVSMLVLQELLGHSGLKMVANYIRLSLSYIADEYGKGVAKMEKQFQV